MARLAGSARLLRAINSSATLAHLLQHGRLTRADLRELTGLSKPTSSEMLRLLTDAGLAMVAGRTSGGLGPTAEIYAPNPEAGYAAAVSVRDPTGDSPGDGRGSGRPSLAAAVCDLAGALRSRVESDVDFASTQPADAVVEILHDAGRRAGITADRIRQVQIAVAGSYDPRSETIRHVDVPGWDRPGLIGEIRRQLQAAVAIDNDVNLAAVAERDRGVASAADGFALVWLDHGIGLAIDLGGTLLRGARGSAGEIGYLPLPAPNGGHDLQDLVGGPAVVALARQHGLRAQTAPEAVAGAVAADPTGPAAQFLTELAARIAYVLGAVVAVLDPPLVVLAGAVAQAGGIRLREAVATATRAVVPLEAEIAVTAVTDDAVLFGALDAGLAALRESLITSLAQPNPA
ncbi:MAG: ROK family protein [Micromonosporaceae bacterium]